MKLNQNKLLVSIKNYIQGMHVIFSGISVNGHVQKKVALRDIAKIEKSQIFVLFENEASYGDCFKSCCRYFV